MSLDKNQAEKHAYYSAEDCAGLMLRITAVTVDLVVLLFLLIPFAFALEVLGVIPPEGPLPRWFIGANFSIAYLYLTALKRSRIRTPGYWVTGLRIVNLKGRPPSMFVMTLRMLWWILGPINPLMDMFFISNNDQRQTIRDKMMGTYVVRRNAKPAGYGHRTMGSFSFMGFMFLFPTVVPEDPRP